ncbi:lipocalin family protein [Flavobacterium sp.]|uniref:lipocalin family protein n=1 Tax=Flavobacterium sp. TaxID=239 RepID=UPI002FDDCDF6
MKNRIKLLALALVISFGFFAVSCNNDDDNGGETIAPLVGKWKISKVGTTVGGTETLIDAPQNQSGCEKDYIDLNTDNTVVQGDYDSTISECALTTQEGIYSRSHNNLTRVVNGVTTVQDIENLTFSQLKLKDASGNIEVYIR